MLPNTGSRLPTNKRRITEADYVELVARALRDELGSTAAAAKTIMRWTGTSNRTARNRVNGVAGPSGLHLMHLARESDAVLSAIIGMAARPELTLAADLHAAEVALAKASGAFAVLRRQRAAGR